MTCLEFGAPQIAKELGRRWKAMGDGEKEMYKAEAAKDKERYAKEVEAYRKSNPEAPMFQVSEDCVAHSGAALLGPNQR